jgi:multiple sugar transport system permease protein
VFTVAWAIARSTPHKDQAWRFVKYLASPRGQELMSNAGLAIPVLREIAEKAIRSEAGVRPRNAHLLLEAADHSDPTDYPPDPAYQQQLRVRVEEIFKLDRPVATSLARVEREWNENRRRASVATQDRLVPWRSLILLGGIPLLAFLAVAAWIWWKRRLHGAAFREELAGMGMIAPWVIGFLIFTSFSVVLSLLLSFARWSSLTTLNQAQFVGWDNFRSIWTQDATFARSLRATAWYALLAVPSSQLVALIAAMLLNRESRSISFFRSIWYLPGVLAGVGMAVMWKWVFHHEYGLLKILLDPVLAIVGTKPPAFLEKDAETWGVPVFALINLWTIGGTMMIYLAGLKGIPKDLYEAAQIDGAVGWKQFRHVTLPMLSPVVFFNVVIALIASFQVFTQAYVMTGGGPGDASRFYVVYLYNQAFDFHEMGYASAMAWMLLLIVLALTLVLMKSTKRFVYYEALK